jgi:hypothetical protein
MASCRSSPARAVRDDTGGRRGADEVRDELMIRGRSHEQQRVALLGANGDHFAADSARPPYRCPEPI